LVQDKRVRAHPKPGRRRRREQAAERPSEQPAGTQPAWIVPVLVVVFLLSGSAGLMHEVVWARLLGHVFGVTSLAVSTVLAAYMGGLALGSFWIGARREPLADGRRAYALLEIGIGLSALLVPLLLHVVEPLYGALWRRFQFSFAAFSVIRFGIASCLLIGPTVMMGATLPVLADYMARLRGRRVAPQWLYTANLLGAVLGVGAAGFLLMPRLGLWGTLALGAGINVGVGLLVLGLPRLSPQPSPAQVEPTVRRMSRLLVAAAFLSGAMSFASQVAWTRVLVLIVGSTTYAFSTVVLVYLVALAAGSARASRGSRTGDVAPALARAHLLMGVCLAGAVYAVDFLPEWYVRLFAVWQPGTIAATVALNVLIVFAVLFVPILFAGMIFPLVMIGAVPHEARGTAEAVGTVYGVNTLGAILGAVAGGFVLVPAVGSQRTLLVVAVSAAAIGVLFALRGGQRWLARGATIVAVLVVAAAFLGPGWRQQALNAAVFEPAGLEDDGTLVHPSDEILYHREGRTATVVVLERDEQFRALRINGRFNASNGELDMPTQVLLAQLPLLLAPRVDDVLIVGWGSGITAGAALQSPVKQVTAIELEPAVIEASEHFAGENHDALRDPRLRLYPDDARHILLASPDSYDVIISEPSHPWVTGVASLFTQDFFALAARRLREDGLFAQWLQGYQMSLETYLSILTTFQSVFPEVIVYSPSYSADWILLGSRQPLRFDLAEIDRRLSHQAVRAETARIGIETSGHLLAGVYLAPARVRAIIQGAEVPINTDDNMRVEFRAPREMIETSRASVVRLTNFMLRYRTRAEAMLAEPNELLKSRAHLETLIAGLERQRLPTEAYEDLLAELE
jgi:spermidine synthase